MYPARPFLPFYAYLHFHCISLRFVALLLFSPLAPSPSSISLCFPSLALGPTISVMNSNEELKGEVKVMVYGERIEVGTWKGFWTWITNQVLYFNIANLGLLLAMIIISTTVQQQISTQQANNAYASTLLLQLGQQVATLQAKIDSANTVLHSANSTLALIQNAQSFFNENGLLNISQVASQYNNLNSSYTVLNNFMNEVAMPVWAPYQPQVYSDGSTKASYTTSYFQYKVLGKTVYVSGVLSIGFLNVGSGGSYLRLQLPLASRPGITQTLGIVSGVDFSAGTLTSPGGIGVITPGNYTSALLVKFNKDSNIDSPYTDQDAIFGYGIVYNFDGSYLID